MNMRYTKPEILDVRQAASVIQGSSHKAGHMPDSETDQATTAAYEADE
jgi:hypothetical protein